MQLRFSVPAIAPALVLVAVFCACGGERESTAAPPTPTPTPTPMPTATADAAAVAMEAPEVAAGRALFAKYCALCHGAGATGYAADNAPSLVNPTFLATADDAFIAAGIRDGRPGTAMAGYAKAVGGPLDDGQVAQIIAFLRNRGPAPTPLTAIAPGVAKRGRPVYEQHCQKCHGSPGKRGEFLHLAQAGLLVNASDEFLHHAITVGRPGTPMVAWTPTLTAQQISDVVALLRSWQGAKPPPPLPKRAEPTGKEPVLVHEKGKEPSWTLREGRFVAADAVAAAYRAKRKMVLVDARPASDWMKGHIPGAISVPHYDMSRLADIPNDGTWVVAYCACPHHASGEVVDELRRRGYKNTAVLDEGILVWEKRGYPMKASAVAPVGVKPNPHDGHDHSGHNHSGHGH